MYVAQLKQNKERVGKATDQISTGEHKKKKKKKTVRRPQEMSTDKRCKIIRGGRNVKSCVNVKSVLQEK